MTDASTPRAPSDIVIRPATPADVSGLGRLGALLVRTHHDFDPKRFIPLKPTNTEVIAARIGASLKYDTTPNWETYEAFLRMSKTLLDRLTPLGAKDMIDVQQFMWVTRDLN